MSAHGLSLMAIEPLPSGDWMEVVSVALATSDHYLERRRNTLVVWREKHDSKGLSYSDGWTVGRTWLERGRAALGVRSQRLYFCSTSGEIDARQEREILGVHRRPDSPKASEQTVSQWSLLEKLMRAISEPMQPVALEMVDADLGTSRIASVSDASYVTPPEKLNSLYKEHGLDECPEGFRISVCGMESVSTSVVEEFVCRLERAAKRRHLEVVVRASSEPSIRECLGDMNVRARAVKSGRCLLFILPKRAALPTSGTLSLMSSLEHAGVPFRRAYTDDPLEFSIPDQLPSLVMAAGGRAHRSPTTASAGPVWTAGVDLSHRPEGNTSVLAVTLVDPDGGLTGAWTTRQPRDETARSGSLTVLLSACGQRLREADGSAKVVVLRDGRLFENEDATLYEAALECDLSLLEYRKRGNPQIVQSNGKPMPFATPVAASVPSATTLFVASAPPRDECALPSFAKVTWKPGWNGLRMTSVEIARMLAASAAAPGLGLHTRHLPAAIYWADGIAGASDSDLRFRGIPAVRPPVGC